MKSHLRGRWTAVPNAIAQGDLSPKATTLLVYRASKPEDWEDRDKDFCRRLGCGKSTLYKVLEELRSAGYIRTEQAERDPGGRFRGKVRIWTLEPDPLPAERTADRSPLYGSSVRRTHTNTDADKYATSSSSSPSSSSLRSSSSGSSSDPAVQGADEKKGKASSSQDGTEQDQKEKKGGAQKKEKGRGFQGAVYAVWCEVFREKLGRWPARLGKYGPPCAVIGRELGRVMRAEGYGASPDEVLDAWRHMLNRIWDHGDAFDKKNFNPAHIAGQFDKYLTLALKPAEYGKASRNSFEQSSAALREVRRGFGLDGD